jgi:hypothetical protein
MVLAESLDLVLEAEAPLIEIIYADRLVLASEGAGDRLSPAVDV